MRNPYSPPLRNFWWPHTAQSQCAGIFLCFLGLALVIAVLTILTILTRLRLPTGTLIVGLLLSIQFATWRFVQAYRRVFLPIELHRFAWACFLAFWVRDEPPAVIRAFSTAPGWSIKAVTTAVIATGIDFAIVAVIVYVTVPWATKRYAGGSAMTDGHPDPKLARRMVSSEFFNRIGRLRISANRRFSTQSRPL